MDLVKIPQGFTCIDFSSNNFYGEIPKELGLLKNLMDNEGLCGPPLTPSCKNDEVALPPKTSHEASHHNSGNKEIKWDLISAEVGFIVGFGTVIGPLVFSSKWRKRYYDRVEDIAYSILPNLLLEKWLSWKMGMRK
ncbi:hypothetical protein FEM48_Zijuj10G0096200 [Ziziphus jujuba var. spinosa]|uniref:Uncharacterized protein n=1 Tax=Ziziphus jujuba var. spinosa TaxID=714518 RepID=A0A978UMM3_ZIZJJ|nr:hypothetical protein FEM48_Zijuj10G0096200 [Ziziphus jujuba var. spinosa]